MTPSAFLAALQTLGWSHRELAQRLGCNRNLPIRWGTGGAPVPAGVAAWLAALVRAVERHPPPSAWRQRSVVGGSRFHRRFHGGPQAV